MNAIQRKAQKVVANTLIQYLSDNPMEKLPKIFELGYKLDRNNEFTRQIDGIRDAISDKDGVWYEFVEDLFKKIDINVLKKTVESFFINGTLNGGIINKEAEAKYDCHIPWAILMDPTSACNLKCTGCWAAQYGDKSNLSYETLDSIIKQGKELGIYFYIYSGGEPLVRKKDIIKLCEVHSDCFFLSFTNGTLIDDAFCEEMLRVGNFAVALSIEGDEKSTDMRRGAGTYQKVIDAMDRLQKHKLIFGYSTCYHSKNTESVGSDEFVDDMIERGCLFSWNFTYMPIGKDAVPELMATAEQRAYMYKRIREIRETKPIFAMDFWNDGEYVNGCIAGGRSYLHINAAGDVEPCAFVHYSNVNIHDVSLIEALKSPIFMAYKGCQPFNDNHLRPCPVLDNPQMIKKMVEESGAKSTDMEAPEDVNDLIAKTTETAEKWAVKADALWAENPKSKKCNACNACEPSLKK